MHVRYPVLLWQDEQGLWHAVVPGGIHVVGSEEEEVKQKAEAELIAYVATHRLEDIKVDEIDLSYLEG